MSTISVSGMGTIEGEVPIMTKDVRYDFIKLDAPLEEKERKYCRCLLRVQDKGGAYSPYGVCTKTTKGHVYSCSQYYDWAVMDLDMLIAYADLHKIQVPTNPTRESMLQVIRNWKISKGH